MITEFNVLPIASPESEPKGASSSKGSSEVSVLSTNASESSIAVLSRGGTEDSREELALDMESANEEFVRTSALSPLVKKANNGPMVESSSSGNA